MSRLTAPFIGVALVAGAFWVATQSYQKNFAGPALDEAKQTELGIQLIEFPRQIPPIERLEQGQWQSVYVQPEFCDAVCQGSSVQMTKLGVHVLPANQATSAELSQILSTEKYVGHQNRVLLLNKEGKFAGSIQPPYTQESFDVIFKALNP